MSAALVSKIALGGIMNYIEGFYCMFDKCMPPLKTCMWEPSCIETLGCILSSDQNAPGSLLNCEVKHAMTGDVTDFTTLTECIFDHGCQPKRPDDMTCKVTREDG
jgi:hypothetical protein